MCLTQLYPISSLMFLSFTDDIAAAYDYMDLLSGTPEDGISVRSVRPSCSQKGVKDSSSRSSELLSAESLDGASRTVNEILPVRQGGAESKKEAAQSASSARSKVSVVRDTVNEILSAREGGAESKKEAGQSASSARKKVLVVSDTRTPGDLYAVHREWLDTVTNNELLIPMCGPEKYKSLIELDQTIESRSDWGRIGIRWKRYTLNKVHKEFGEFVVFSHHYAVNTM